jgi:hypothetical protein
MTKSTTKSSKAAPSKQTAGYSGTPLVKKLGMKAGQRVIFVNEPPHFQSLLIETPVLGKSDGKSPTDYVHLFVKTKSELKALLRNAKKGLAQDGMIWVSWPKKRSGISSDISENVIRDFALSLGLVDVKVCAIDETWSGLKLVIRRENRTG